ARKEDIVIVVSPVGMPGRAVKTPFSEKMRDGRIPIKSCYNCLTPCNPKEAPYCISDALINSVNGDVDNGLVFCGSSTWRMKQIVNVKELFRSIIEEAEQ